MAMGQAGRREALRRISNHQTFANSTASFHGHSGAARDMGWLSSRSDVGSLRESARRASYTVYSYDTPIGWAIEDEETGLMECVIPEEPHSTTTSGHQNIVRQAWDGNYHDGTRDGRARWLSEHRTHGSDSESRMDFAGQDELMDEVSGYRAPAHP